MTEKKKIPRPEDQFAFYMDLLGHDILNSNQAVLSYLELIMATPGADKKVRGFAEKAVSHVRTSTVLIDNVKRLIATRGLDAESLKPIDMVKSIERVESELRRYFPSKRIKFELSTRTKTAYAFGNDYAIDLILNVFLTAVRLDPNDDVMLKVSLAEDMFKGKPAWVMRLEDENSKLPPFVNGEGVAATYSQDISTAVKTTGILFAKMIAVNLGGDFEAHALVPGPKKRGALFTTILRKAERP